MQVHYALNTKTSELERLQENMYKKTQSQKRMTKIK